MTEDRQQRRLATILAADVFGYSRLMAENEEATLRTLKAYRAITDRLIARHDGRIFNTAGDSVLAEFTSAVEAVRCAIAIQEELRVRNAEIPENRRMDFRIGINVGDVLIDGDNLYGDGVNIAARLESVATPGNICISGSVHSLVKNKLSHGFEDIGPQTMKNIPEPVPAFRLTSGSAARPAATGPQPPAGACCGPGASAGSRSGNGNWNSAMARRRLLKPIEIEHTGRRIQSVDRQTGIGRKGKNVRWYLGIQARWGAVLFAEITDVSKKNYRWQHRLPGRRKNWRH